MDYRTIEEINYSVLMSVYAKEKPEYLQDAMNSIWNQTKKTNNFILVCDGPLTEELNLVIKEMEDTHKTNLQVIRLNKNEGLGNALNKGIKYCKNDLIARMDSDDISRKDRCEKQLSIFLHHPEISICSGIVEEFSKSLNLIEARRIPPEKHDEIVEFAKKRNPFNHPCVMYSKKAVNTAGGYKDFYLLEDYFLWIRMLNDGFRGYNIQEPLLWMRAGSGMYKRRSGIKYAKSQRSLFRYMKEIKFISQSQYLISVAERSVSAILPNSIRTKAFKRFMRKEEEIL